jgi:hypothetical protein
MVQEVPEVEIIPIADNKPEETAQSLHVVEEELQSPQDNSIHVVDEETPQVNTPKKPNNKTIKVPCKYCNKEFNRTSMKVHLERCKDKQQQEHEETEKARIEEETRVAEEKQRKNKEKAEKRKATMDKKKIEKQEARAETITYEHTMEQSVSPTQVPQEPMETVPLYRALTKQDRMRQFVRTALPA